MFWDADCHGLIFVSPQNSYVEDLTSNVMLFGGRPLEGNQV